MIDQKPLFAQLIRSARETRLFLSQHAFAKLIEQYARDAGDETLVCDQSTVSRWESGDSIPALRYRPHIATALGMEAVIIFTGVAA